MSCDLTKGRVEPCKDSVGGLANVYFIIYDDFTFSEVSYDVTDTDVIDELSATGITAYKYELKSTSNSFEQTINSSRDTGTTFFEQTLNLTFKKLTKEDNKELKLMAYGRPLVIVEDNSGNLFLAGLEHGMDVTGGSVVTGGAMGDLSGYTLTLTGQEKVPANFCIPTTGATVAAKLIALGVTSVVSS
jgi:hypothetical protein